MLAADAVLGPIDRRFEAQTGPRACGGLGSGPGGALFREDRHARGSRRAVELGVPDLRIVGDLPVAGFAAQLTNDLVHLTKSRRADRLAVRDEPAVGVRRERTVDL